MIEHTEAIWRAGACRARGPDRSNKGMDKTKIRLKNNTEGKVRWPKISRKRVVIRGLCAQAVKLAYWYMPGQVVLDET